MPAIVGIKEICRQIEKTQRREEEGPDLGSIQKNRWMYYKMFLGELETKVDLLLAISQLYGGKDILFKEHFVCALVKYLPKMFLYI